MSLRNIEVQYIGDTLYLPPLEREVKHVVVRNEDVKDWEHFEPKLAGDDYKQAAEYWQRMYEESFTERTCKVIEMHEHVTMDEPDIAELSCGHDIMVFDMEPPNYCPVCGAKVVSE